jgi:PKD repeat protein
MRGSRGLGLAALAAVLATFLTAPSPAQAQTVPHNAVVSANPADFTPHVLDGKVNSIVQIGDTVILGGAFTQVQAATGGPVLARNNVVAFHATTGAISTTFAPSTNGEVTTVLPAADGQSVYLGGFFNNVNAAANSRSLARVNLSNGALTTGFRPPVMNGRVKDLRLTGNRLWVGGTFSTIAGQAQPALATLNPNTGAFDPYMRLQFADPRGGGVLQVLKQDVTGNGSRFVAIGNFDTVDGRSRPQLVVLDLTGATAQVADWATQTYAPNCASAFDSYLRDLDISPDGSYFVVSTTGAYRGYANNTPCDTTMRFELGATGESVPPTWLNYTGGDTTYAVAVTGTAVYVGGHFRWQNNPYAGDQAGPGAVAREGIAALDPVNGLPFSWNPGRAKGVGVFDMLATPAGLWVASDTDRIGGWEYHGRISFFPLAGGTAIAPYATGTLPGHVFLAGGQPAGPAPESVLYRVNAGGETLPSGDSGPEWTGDGSSPHRNGGSNAAGWAPVGAVDASVSPTTPSAIFDTERWDSGDAPDMSWTFPVPDGIPLQVRLYFASRCDCTSSPGSRVFDVSVEGATVLDDYDIVATSGHDVGTMKSFNVTSDGTVNIDFGHVVENPLVNGIEIVRTDIAAPAAPANADDLRDVYFDGTTAQPGTVAAGTGVDWSTARGAVMIDGSVYTGHADGSFVRRTFDGTSFGPAVPVDGSDRLVPLDNWHTDVSRITGLFFDRGRLYYTVAGSASLYYRGFTPQSDVVGALRYTASSGVPGIDFSKVQGMFLAGGKLYFGSALDGTLRRIDWSADGPVEGTATTVAGPAEDGNDWRSRGMFLYTGTNLPGPRVNTPPDADAQVSCTALTCTYDGGGSTDADGSIPSTGYAWDFGDGATATGATAGHTYAAAGTYTVNLTVTDNEGATNTASRSVTVSPAPAAAISYRGGATSNTSATTHRVTVPANVVAGDGMVLIASTATTVTVGTPGGVPGWQVVSSVDMGGGQGTTTIWQKVAAAGDANKVVTVSLSALAKTGLTLVAYAGTDTTAPVAVVQATAETVSRAAHTTPAVSVARSGSVVVSYWADRTTSTTAWTPPAGESVRTQTFGLGGGHISNLLTDSGGPVPSGTRNGVTATANAASEKAVMASIVLAPRG